jgi:hypothetical protein
MEFEKANQRSVNFLTADQQKKSDRRVVEYPVLSHFCANYRRTNVQVQTSLNKMKNNLSPVVFIER